MDAVLLVSRRVARRSANSNQKTALGDLLLRLSDEFKADHEVLEKAMHVLRVRSSRLKRAAMWGSEVFGRMKLNGRLIRYSPLSRVYELQALVVLIELKRSLWEVLRSTQGGTLSAVDLDDMIAKAGRQAADIQPHLTKAIDNALKND